MVPSKKAIKKLTEEIHTQTSRRYTCLGTSDMVRRLNMKTRGWANYFCTGAVSRIYSKIARYTCGRFRRWLKDKFKWNTWHYKELDDGKMCQEYNLLNMIALTPKYS
jgi:RNA-directed DNA polymerase